MIAMSLLKLTKNGLVLPLALFAAHVSAQGTLADYRKLYPDYNEFILNDIQQYDFSIENKKLKVIQDNHYESMILTENGIQNNEETFTYSELVRLKNYEAYSVLNNDGHEKKVKVTQSNENAYRSSSIFHNDVKERQLIFPNLNPGAKKIYDYEVEFSDPYLLH